MARRTRRIHFVGIGGIGMSGIAEVLSNLGYEVSGSDLESSDTTVRLESLGVRVQRGHSADAIASADVVVVSSAIRPDNPEVEAARRVKIPVIRRAEMLAELMRLEEGIAIGGTHGKTTTTSMVAYILGHAGLDPTVVVGGKINKIGANAKLGRGPYFVAEADESDGSFLHLSPTIAVVTNIDPEHLDHYAGGMDAVRDAYTSFVNRVPFYGLGVVCIDHPGVQAIAPRLERRFVTYGTSPQADHRARNVEFDGPRTRFDLEFRGRSEGTFELRMLGVHNVQNALAAIAVAEEVGVSFDTTREALREFDGVERRFTVRGIVDDIMVVDDYGHHPEEIRATLRGARLAYPMRRILVGFQPHRHTRTRDLEADFASAFHEADALWVTPIYGAGERPIDGVSSERLVERISLFGHRDVRFAPSVADAGSSILKEVRPGDLVIFLGAGDIGRAAAALVEELSKDHER